MRVADGDFILPTSRPALKSFATSEKIVRDSDLRRISSVGTM
jgi:hypothetical protein